jgi:hypothetical protein
MAVTEVLPDRSLDQDFFDLVYGDPDLVAAAFDELVAASWGRPPAAGGGRIGDHRPRRPQRDRGGPHRATVGAECHLRPGCRWQRGPPEE